MSLKRFTIGLALTLLSGFLAPSGAVGQDRSVAVASTTSTEQSGLFGYLLPLFTAKTGIAVKVVAVGTGQALELGRRGDADVLFVHDRPAEEKFIGDGFGIGRRDVMYNDFVLIGPAGDPAKAAGSDLSAGLRRIAATKAAFISRGDRSGTHTAELRAWHEAAVEIAAVKGNWYREIGQGMGPALNMASALGAYTLSDRGTWLSFKNRGELRILVEGDPRLFNPYGVMLVNPARHPEVKAAEGQAFIDWLVSAEGQSAIAGFRIGGEPLFFPNADGSGRS